MLWEVLEEMVEVITQPEKGEADLVLATDVSNVQGPNLVEENSLKKKDN